MNAYVHDGALSSIVVIVLVKLLFYNEFAPFFLDLFIVGLVTKEVNPCVCLFWVA